jgi:hypothetical protein
MTAKTQIQTTPGSNNGKWIFESMIAALEKKSAAMAA